MLKYSQIILVAFSIFVLLAPDLAEARAGGKSSMGSRGSRTYAPSPSRAQPIQRSETPRNPTTAPTNATQGSFNGQQPAAAPAGGTFWRGMAGGFVGAGIASMLFGHSAGAAGSGAAGEGGAGNAFGGLLQLLLLGGLIYFVYRMFKRRQNGGFNSGGGIMSGFASPQNYETPDVTTPLNIVENDKAAFEQALIKIQKYWSEGEINKLRQVVTPEMVEYFSDEMSANSSNGVANKVENVRLESADVIESWREFNMDYATVRLQWSALDYMVSLDKEPAEEGYITSGSNIKTEIAEEIWTFTRSSDGGNWLLSAIQQVA